MSKYREDGSEVKYWLYKIPKGNIFTVDAYYAIYEDAVPESSKIYMSGVSEECKTVAAAMAWKFSDDEHVLTPMDWQMLKVGVDYN